jgi:ElaB/YqjD/DUF883 family membrane-anchored ribosome-binding protein
MESSGSTWNEANTRTGGLADELNEKLKDAGASLHDIDDRARTFVKDRPLVALGTAAVGGFLLGRLFSRL